MLLSLATFTAAAVLIILVPGPDTLVVLRSIVRGGRAHGWTTVAGVLTGLAAWVAIAALGLAAVLRASSVAYDVLRVAGAGYLTWLGIQSLRSFRRRPPEPVARARSGIVGTGFLAGLVTDLLNPKVGVFFVTFLPGFIPHGDPVAITSLLFGTVYVVLTLAYFVLLLAFVARLTSWMGTPRVRRRIDAVTGTVLVGFGIRLAVDS